MRNTLLDIASTGAISNKIAEKIKMYSLKEMIVDSRLNIHFINPYFFILSKEQYHRVHFLRSVLPRVDF